MINYLSNKFISICLEEKIIDVDSDIYKYGFESILSSYLCIAIVLFTGIFIKYKLIAFFYLLIFYFIRKYSGGYHCDSYLKCIIWTDFIFILSVIMIDNLNYELLIPLCIVCSIFSIKKAPICHFNKPFTNSQRKIFKQKYCHTIYILLSLGIISTFLYPLLSKLIFVIIIINAFLMKKGEQKNEKRITKICG